MNRSNFFQIVLLFTSFAALAAENPLSSAIPSDDPEKLVRAFCRADGFGMVDSSEYWLLLQKYTVWEDAPGWDTGYAVSSFKVVTKTRTKNAAQIEVTYDIIGSLEPTREDGGWKIDKNEGGIKHVVFHVEQRNGQWKILSPQNPPRLSAEYAIAFIGNRCGKYDCKNDPTLNILRKAIQKPNYSFEPMP
jgi:hypothetical protein